MPIEIKQLHIKSSVTQRAGEGAAAAKPVAAAAGGCGDDSASPQGEREQTLAECRRMIREAISQLQER